MSEEKVIIIYNGLKTILLVSMNETMEDILKKYVTKIKKDINELYFIYDGNEINKEKKYKEIINNIDKEKKEMIIFAYNIIDNNYIIGEIEINEDNINEDIRIINSFEEIQRQEIWLDYKGDYENEKEIKDNCKIKINNNIIPFNYFCKFKKKGKYIIQYSFKKNLTKINYMFYDCKFISNLDLSNFNTQKVTNMKSLFSRCSSLSKLDLSNFNTQNVTDMNSMFDGCSSLTSIDVTKFNTQNVTYMSNMFDGCKSLTSILVSNINHSKFKEIVNNDLLKLN